MDIHVDHQDRSIDFHGQPTTPDISLVGPQLLAMEFLARCMRDLEPLAAVTGGAGTGKTIALNTALARQESDGSHVIRVNNFVAGPLSLHRVLAASLGVADAGELSAEELEPVLRRAVARIGQAEPPVLAVDDAQSLLPETLRYLCLLAGLREGGRPLFRILLVGRPGFTVRQAIPLQFALEPIRPAEAREMVQHRLAASGVTLRGEEIHDVVQRAQGNLRILESLLQTSIEQARSSGRRRTTVVAGQAPAAARRTPRPLRRRSLGAWLVVPALLVVAAAGAAIVYHDGATPRHDDKLANAAALSATVPATAPAAGVEALASNPSRPPSEPEIPANVPQSAPPVPQVATQSSSGDAAGRPGSATPAPDPIKPPVGVPAVVPAPVAVAPKVAAAPAPVPDVAPAPQPPDRVLAPPPVPVQQAQHFRVYNISACHHGVCPRWSVTDVDQRSRFVAAFDISALHLDRDTVRRLREGAVDAIVSGSVTRNGPDGRTLVAETLQTIAPHRGLQHSSSAEPADLSAPPQTQSPPPGFLAMPVDGSRLEPLPPAPVQ